MSLEKTWQTWPDQLLQ